MKLIAAIIRLFTAYLAPPLEIVLIREEESGYFTKGRMTIRGKLLCYTLEDAHNDPKIPGETRIPKGEYPLVMRTHGGMHNRYLERYGKDFHKGMIEIANVPGFTDVLIHIGNTVGDTEGCVLVGSKFLKKKGVPFLASSRRAYERVYPGIAKEILRGRRVTLKIEGSV